MTKATSAAGDMLTVLEAAQKLGITRRSVYELIANGRLPGSVLVGLQRLIPRKAVEGRIQSRKGGDHGQR
jgi:excisionase family DNA binding protein